MAPGGTRSSLVPAGLCLTLGLGWLFFRGAPERPDSRPAPGPAAAFRKPAPRVEPPGTATPTLPQADPAPAMPTETAKGRDWKALLEGLAPEGWSQAHPGELERLAALAGREALDEEREAGLVAHLLEGLPPDAACAAWERAAEALPGNGAVADVLLREATAHAGEKDLKSLLERQRTRAPENPQALWLLASLALQRGDSGEADALLREAAGLPPWRERTGLAERGSLKVQDALTGKPEPLPSVFRLYIVHDAVSSTHLPELGRMKRVGDGLARTAATLHEDGRDAQALASLEAGLRMGESVSKGSRNLATLLSGLGIERKAAQALKEHALATGDGALRDRAESLLSGLREEGDRIKRWSRSGHEDDAKRLKGIVRGTGIAPPQGGDREDNLRQWMGKLATMQQLLLEDDRRFLEAHERDLMEGSEMDRYRSWKVAP